ncbi:MAG TPA: hypothetical protein VN457_08420, partial [Chlamydiales bacterium]|nr:hypothetical protein [Chlamydiales bacterium]
MGKDAISGGAGSPGELLEGVRLGVNEFTSQALRGKLKTGHISFDGRQWKYFASKPVVSDRQKLVKQTVEGVAARLKEIQNKAPKPTEQPTIEFEQLGIESRETELHQDIEALKELEKSEIDQIKQSKSWFDSFEIVKDWKIDRIKGKFDPLIEKLILCRGEHNQAQKKPAIPISEFIQEKFFDSGRWSVASSQAKSNAQRTADIEAQLRTELEQSASSSKEIKPTATVIRKDPNNPERFFLSIATATLDDQKKVSAIAYEHLHVTMKFEEGRYNCHYEKNGLDVKVSYYDMSYANREYYSDTSFIASQMTGCYEMHAQPTNEFLSKTLFRESTLLKRNLW